MWSCFRDHLYKFFPVLWQLELFMVYEGLSEPPHNRGMEIISCRSHCIPPFFYKSKIGAFAQEVENILLPFWESIKIPIFTRVKDTVNENQREVLT